MVNDKRDETSGQFGRKYDDETFLDALAELGEAGTKDVADHLGADRDTARRRLHALADRGDIERRKIAGAILWNLAETDGGQAKSNAGDGPDPERVIRAVRLTIPDSNAEAVAHALDVSRETAHSRLRDLTDTGRFEAVTVGNETVYRVVDD